MTTLIETKPLCAIGLMSGTSLDGIDIAVLTTNGETVSKFGPTATAPYSRKLREKVRSTLGGIGDASAVAPLVELALSTNLDDSLRRAAIMNLHRMAIPEATAGLQEVITGLGEQEGTDELLQLARDQG